MTIDLHSSQQNRNGSPEIASSISTSVTNENITSSQMSIINRASNTSINSVTGDTQNRVDINIDNRFAIPQKIGQIPVPYRMIMDESQSIQSQEIRRIQKHRSISRQTINTNRTIYPDNRAKILPNSSIMMRHSNTHHSEQDYDDEKDERQCSSHNGPTKGLRQFSLRVCKKVEERGVTSYNEVADELVRDLGQEIGKGDQKNIRRRVYDALNVLMAMEIIRKEKKEIIWLGLPNGLMQDLEIVRKDKQSFQNRILQKKKILQEMILRQTALKNLIQRNKIREEQYISEAVSNGLDPATALPSSQDILHLPFILISAPRDCRVNCEMLEDRSHYYFEFDSPFMIHEDIEILKLMGLYQTSISTVQPMIISNNNASVQPITMVHRDNTDISDVDPILSMFQDDARSFYQGLHIDRNPKSVNNTESDGVDPRHISPIKRSRFSAEWQDCDHIERDDIVTALSSPIVSRSNFVNDNNEMSISYSRIDSIGISEHTLASDPNPEIIARQKSLNRNLSLR